MLPLIRMSCSFSYKYAMLFLLQVCYALSLTSMLYSFSYTSMLCSFSYKYVILFLIQVCYGLSVTSMLYSFSYKYAMLFLLQVCYTLSHTSMLYALSHTSVLCYTLTSILCSNSYKYTYIHTCSYCTCYICMIAISSFCQRAGGKRRSFTWAEDCRGHQKVHNTHRNIKASACLSVVYVSCVRFMSVCQAMTFESWILHIYWCNI